MPRGKRQPSKSSPGLTLVRECPVCRQAYTPEGIAIIRRETAVRILHLTCMKCESALLACIRTVEAGMALVGVVTDVSAPEASRLIFGTTIGENHIFAFHRLLSTPRAIETYFSRNNFSL